MLVTGETTGVAVGLAGHKVKGTMLCSIKKSREHVHSMNIKINHIVL